MRCHSVKGVKGVKGAKDVKVVKGCEGWEASGRGEEFQYSYFTPHTHESVRV